MTKRNIPISVITPSFNGGKYIKNCIESVRNQTINVEHIVVDGGSSDDTLEIVRSYPDIKLISEPDTGMYDAINKGLKIANGDIVGYLNTDDQYLPNTIGEVVKAFVNQSHLDYLYGNCIYIDNQNTRLYEYKSIPYIRLFVKNMQEIHWAQPSCFWKKSIHAKVGYFDDNLKFCGDYDFFNRLTCGNYNGLRLNIPLTFFMLHDDALTIKSHLALTAEHQTLRSKYKPKHNLFWGFLGELTFKIINIQAIIKKYLGYLGEQPRISKNQESESRQTPGDGRTD